MNDHAASGVELLATMVALEVFCSLMGDQNLLILEITLAVPAPGTSWFLLVLLCHVLDWTA